MPKSEKDSRKKKSSSSKPPARAKKAPKKLAMSKSPKKKATRVQKKRSVRVLPKENLETLDQDNSSIILDDFPNQEESKPSAEKLSTQEKTSKTENNDQTEILSTDHTVKPAGLILPDQVLPMNLFVLPTNSPIIFPSLLAPILITIPRYTAMIEEAINRERMIGLVQTRELEVGEKLSRKDLFEVGVVAKIVKRLKMPDGSVNILVHSMKRFRMKKILSENPYIVAETEYLDDQVDKTLETDAMTRSVVSHVKKLAEVNPFFTEEMRLAMVNAPGPGTVADLVAFALGLGKNDAQDYLETVSVQARLEKLLYHLKREQDVADLQKKINEEVNTKLTKLQRDFFLKEQLKTIKRELGSDSDPKDKATQSFRERIEEAKMSEEAKKIALEELEKFESMSEHSPEHNLTRNYLEVLCSLPWSKESEDNLDLNHAQDVLDQDHYGMDKVKERILEFLAVRHLKKDRKGSAICLVGPPGVGKTSIGRSIAKTLGRQFFRFSLGGMRDEAEIKGHRRTYVGAMPGKVLQGMKRAGTLNPVLMLDEIDKLGQSYQGDPASALLEVLDPEQNYSFLDHYVDVPFDLSQVLFITTANSTATIPAPLLDRMELIELPGYTLEEKESIASRYVIPKEMEANGINPMQVRIDKQALRKMMTDYAREPGLRSLQKLINKIARKSAAKIVKNETQKPNSAFQQIRIREDDLTEWLGPKRFYNELAERIKTPGITVGLAWTSMGGDILFIEATQTPGSGQLKLTGQMGEVMNESANIAWTFVKNRIFHEKQKEKTFFKEHDFHLHIPAGAIPKDGPSAGITMAATLYSLLTGRKAKTKLAMTGELSLVGKVLPVGGIKEKLLAAKRAGVTTVLLPKLNEKDLLEVPDYAIKGMQIHFVSSVDEVFDRVLEKDPEISGRKTISRNKPTRKTKKKAKYSTPSLAAQRKRPRTSRAQAH